MSRFLTVDEAAARLGVQPLWVYKLIWNGKLPAKKVSGGWFISEAAIVEREQYLKVYRRRA